MSSESEQLNLAVTRKYRTSNSRTVDTAMYPFATLVAKA